MLNALKIALPIILLIGILLPHKKTEAPFSVGLFSTTTAQVNSASVVSFSATTSSSTSTPGTEILAGKSAEVKDSIEQKQEEPEPVLPIFTLQESKLPEVVFNESWGKSIINLFCASKSGSISSGSGVFIDKRGIIITNAHVAATFLFSDDSKDSLYDCSVRIGSPSSPTYRASLIYLPEAWVKAQTEHLYDPEELSTRGDSDYALLVITERTDPLASLPDSFPYLEIDTETVYPVSTNLYLLGYSSEYIGGGGILRGLNLLTAPGKIESSEGREGDDFQDIIGLGGTLASQHGSSGGAVIAGEDKLIGLMTFFEEINGYKTSEKTLNAITLSYISRDMKDDVGLSLEEYIGYEIGELRNLFDSKMAPFLRGMYYEAWQKNN